MWYFRKPSDALIRSFLERHSGEPFSYCEVGASRGEAPPGYDLDQNSVLLGKGPAVFEAARDALRCWRMFPPSWTQIEPAGALIQEGNVVAMLARVFGVWWLNACRIVYVFDEREPVRRFGFAYGTLPKHVERGEERFSVEWHADDTVWYAILAFSRPRYWLTRLGYPLARRVQRRFARDSLAALRRAVEGAGVPREA
jgi:uncharacterized protein (UPF0548 family)